MWNLVCRSLSSARLCSPGGGSDTQPELAPTHLLGPRQTCRPRRCGRLSGGFLHFKIASVLSSHRRFVAINSRRKEIPLLGRTGSAQKAHAEDRDAAGRLWRSSPNLRTGVSAPSEVEQAQRRMFVWSQGPTEEWHVDKYLRRQPLSFHALGKTGPRACRTCMGPAGPAVPGPSFSE